MYSVGRVLSTVLWRRLDVPGTEYCQLLERPDGWTLVGTAVQVLDEKPATVTYEVHCNRSWATRDAYLELSWGVDERRLHLVVDRRQEWYGNGDILLDVRDCVDVDLGITPATNTLPIRRLGLAIGERRDVIAAWVRFPELWVEPLSQTYTRLDTYRYGYTSSTGFATELTVDDLGLVQVYEGGWTRAASEQL